MSLNEQIIRQRDFSGGEIDPDAIRRDDMEILGFASRRARNMVSTHTGALVRRPGRRMLFENDGIHGEFRPFDDISYTLVFVAGGVVIRTQDGTYVTTLGAPWGANDLANIVFETFDNEVFVVWGGEPQVLRISDTDFSWSITPFRFATGINGAVRMPFHRFDGTLGITMTASSWVGSVTVTFSAPVLTANHVGTIFRYAGRQVRITAVLGATVGIADVLEELPKTWGITVEDTAGYSIGQLIETDTTNVTGEVVNVVGNIVYVVATNKLTSPQIGEKLVGPTAASKITAVSSSGPSYTVQWDEQFMSQNRGWPRSVSKDRQRLIFSNWPQKKNAVFWSAVGNPHDGFIGSEPADAMLEFVGAECQVYHVVGGYDEFAVTDKGIFYIPVSVGTPLQPGSVEFRPIFSSEIANIRPIEVTEGLLFVDKSQTGIYAISATGQTARPYIANEINRYHRPLFSGVKSIAATSATKEFQSRQIYAVNDDGSIVVGQFNPDRESVGWFLWSADGGVVKSVSGSYGKVVMMTSYDFGGAPLNVGEEVDYSLLCDCAMALDPNDSSDFLALSDGSPLQLSGGASITLSQLVGLPYAGREVSVFGGGFYLGKATVGIDGLLVGFGDYAQVTIGVEWDWDFVPLFTNFEGGQPVGQGEQRRKVSKLVATVRDTQEFMIGERIFGSWRGGEDMALPIPSRDTTYTYRESGRSYDPVVPFKSTVPGKFKLIELTTRITV
ncbi:hypothetical protein [Agrobacterium tumefaciens]|uniref:hypothetical protein n=1 Tax=Agrobacterium tumefaciens TaxID=358 RepID=UPI0004701987